MALIPPERVQCVYQDGQCGRTALYAVKNVDAADTVDVATHFSIVKRGGIVSDTGTTIGAVTIAGTVLTVPTGPSDDALWLLVVGVAS